MIACAGQCLCWGFKGAFGAGCNIPPLPPVLGMHLQGLFDYTQRSDARGSSSSSAAGLTPELHVDQPFDVEQIWLQLEMQLGEWGGAWRFMLWVVVCRVMLVGSVARH